MRESGNRDSGEGRGDLAALALLTVIALLLRFYRIGAESLWLDEAYSWHLASADAWSVLAGGVGNRHTPPLYYVLLHYWMKIGVSEAALRSLSAILGALAVPLLHGLAKGLLGRRAALVAAGGAALSPFLVYYGQEARGYTLLVVLVLLGARSLLHYVDRGRLRDGALFALLSILSLYTHYYGAFVLVGANLFALGELRRDRGRLLRWIAIQGVIALAFLPWIVNLLGVGFGRGQVFRRFLFTQVPYSFLRFGLGYGLLPLSVEAKRDVAAFAARNLPLLALTFGAFGYLLVRGARRARGAARRFFLIYLVAPFLLALLVSLRFNLISERYLIVAFPFFLALVAAGFGGKGWVGRIASAAALLLTFAGLGGHHFNPRAGKTQWRGAAALVRERGEPEDVVLLAPSFIDLPFRYYYEKEGRSPLPVHGLQRREEFDRGRFEREWEAIGGAPRFWLVVAHTEHVDFYLDLIGGRAREKERIFLPKENGITVALFERVGGR